MSDISNEIGLDFILRSTLILTDRINQTLGELLIARSNEIRDVAIYGPDHAVNSVVIGLAEAFSMPKEEHKLSLWALLAHVQSAEENITYRTYLLFVAEALK